MTLCNEEVARLLIEQSDEHIFDVPTYVHALGAIFSVHFLLFYYIASKAIE